MPISAAVTVYALCQIGNQNQTQKTAIVKILASVMDDKGETIEVRWLAATALLKLGKNVDSFFSAWNLPKPVANNWVGPGEAWIAYGIDLTRCYFDLYAARFLFAKGTEKGGSFEIFSMVRQLLTETRGKGAASPSPKPASTNR